MFTQKTPAEKTGLEKAIDEALTDMNGFTSETDEYSQIVDQLTKLYNLKDIDRPKGPSADTLVLVTGNLVGILMIVGYERANIVTSKALNFLLKLR